MAGTYAQYNLSAEQSMLRNLWQANVGVKLSGKKNFWLDAGVFPSHIGFESAVGKSCDALTRCIIGDNTPFMKVELKSVTLLTTANGSIWISYKWLAKDCTCPMETTLLLSEHKLRYSKRKVTFNYSTFIGNDKTG